MTNLTVLQLLGSSVTMDASGVKIMWSDIEAVLGLPSGFTKTDTGSSGADLLRALLLLVASNVAVNGATGDNDVNIKMRSAGLVKNIYTSAGNSNKERFEVQIFNRVGAQTVA